MPAPNLPPHPAQKSFRDKIDSALPLVLEFALIVGGVVLSALMFVDVTTGTMKGVQSMRQDSAQHAQTPSESAGDAALGLSHHSYSAANK